MLHFYKQLSCWALSTDFGLHCCVSVCEYFSQWSHWNCAWYLRPHWWYLFNDRPGSTISNNALTHKWNRQQQLIYGYKNTTNEHTKRPLQSFHSICDENFSSWCRLCRFVTFSPFVYRMRQLHNIVFFSSSSLHHHQWALSKFPSFRHYFFFHSHIIVSLILLYYKNGIAVLFACKVVYDSFIYSLRNVFWLEVWSLVVKKWTRRCHTRLQNAMESFVVARRK